MHRYFDLLNSGDPTIAHQILSPDVVFVGPRAPTGVRGIEAFLELVADIREDSPDLQFEEGETVVEGDRVASVFTMTRTHRGGTEEAKVVATEGMDLFHVSQGKIVRVQAYFDRLTLLAELGLVTPPQA